MHDAEIAGAGKALASLAEIDAVGFKAVHAGPLNEPQLIGDEFLAAMDEFSSWPPRTILLTSRRSRPSARSFPAFRWSP